MSSSVSSSSPVSQKNYFAFEENPEESSEQTEQVDNIEISNQNNPIINNNPTGNFNASTFLTCFYVIVNLNLAIKQQTKDMLSLKETLAFKSGIDKLDSFIFFKKNPTSNSNTSHSSKKEINKYFLKNKYYISNKLSLQEKSESPKQQTLLLSTANYDTASRTQCAPKGIPINTSVFSKPSSTHQKNRSTSSFVTNTSKEPSKHSALNHNIVIQHYFQSTEEHKELTSDEKDRDSQDKHHEKDQDQENTEKREEKIKLINKLAKNKKFLSKSQEQLSSLTFQEIDMFIKEKVSSLSQLKTDHKDFLQYALQTSILSQVFHMRISNLDVLILFIEVMKLALKSRQQQHLFRSEERLLQLSHMKEIVCSYKNQANSLLFSGLASGLLAVFSGVAPIFGHIKGEWTLGHLSKIFSKIKDMEAEKFFENASKITLATSEMSKATGQIQTAFNESHRTHDDHYKESYKIDAEDRARAIEEIKDNWRTIENFLYQCLQMQHDTIKQLYQ